MGVVHRATDTKLKRDVALKVLPEAFARDPERLARFEREAEVLESPSCSCGLRRMSETQPAIGESNRFPGEFLRRASPSCSGNEMIGTSLGMYRITAKLGAGGMGEVYRAIDTKLKRDVALKVLPEAFARDPERMARFQREAEVLASLNHANSAPALRAYTHCDILGMLFSSSNIQSGWCHDILMTSGAETR